MRAKRRDRGIGFEDSDSDDEDDENARRRQKIAKKRRLDGGDSLDQLGAALYSLSLRHYLGMGMRR